MNILKSQATASLRIFVFYLTSSTTLGPLTGVSFGASDIQVGSNGAAPSNSAGTVTQVSASLAPGMYYYTPTTGEIGTDGSIQLTIAPSGSVSRSYSIPVVELDVYTSVPNAVWNALVASYTAAGSFGEQVGNPQGTVGAGTNGPTVFSTSLTTSTGSGSSTSLVGQWIYFLSGACKGQSAQVASCDGSGNITCVIPAGQTQALTTSPSSGDRIQVTGK